LRLGHLIKAFMVSLSNHEGLARTVVRDRFMVRPGGSEASACAHHQAVNAKGHWYPLKRSFAVGMTEGASGTRRQPLQRAALFLRANDYPPKVRVKASM
jgi:hypothetical protein